MITYCRTDLCPNCNTRFTNIHNQHDPRWDHITILDYPIYTTYKDKLCVNIKCFGCHNVYAKDYVYDYWASHMKEESNETTL